jgi:hypothetical protein
MINRQEKAPRFRQIRTTEVKIPVKTTFWAGLLALCLIPAGAMAQDASHVAPPVPLVEQHDHAPHDGWIWVEGHHRWDGHRYVWVHGFWVHPPHPGAVWVRHHWEQRNGDWVLVPGHWE